MKILAASFLLFVAALAARAVTPPVSYPVAEATPAASGGAPRPSLPPPTLPPEPVATAAEPFAARLSPAKAAAYLDTIAVNWTDQRRCGTCHTNYAYMMARPLLHAAPAVAGAGESKVRGFFDRQVRLRASRPALPHTLILAAMLAINDAQHGGGLSDATREALDQTWEMQADDGAWPYPEIFYSPPLGDPWYGAAMVALATGIAPDHYAETPAARAGMARLRVWFARHPAQSLHQRIILLWASCHTKGLMTPAQRATTIAALRALQRRDGGWNLPSLGQWNRRDGSPNDPKADSDGYATGLITYVLQQTGVEAREAPVAAGLAWLVHHQRASGRWFTHSINTDDKGNLISNIGTAYAVMALAQAKLL